MKLFKIAKNIKKRAGLGDQDIEFKCQHCGKDLIVAVEGGGKSFPCPECQQTVKVPTLSELQTKFNITEEGTEQIDLPDLKETGFMSGLFKSKNAPKQKDQTYNVDVAQNKDSSPGILDRILSYNRTDMVACLAVANPNCPREWVEKIAKKAMGSKDAVPVQFVLYALRNPNCPAEVLSEIARKSLVPALQKEALAHHNMDEATLRELEQKANDDLRALIVRNPNCPADILTKAALGKRTERAAIVAVSNPHCPPDTLFRVLSGFSGDVLSFTALKHPNCPMEIIHAILLRDEDDQISRVAASREKIDERTIRMVLARNQLDAVSKAIGTRSDAPKDAVKAWRDATGQNSPVKAHEPT